MKNLKTNVKHLYFINIIPVLFRAFFEIQHNFRNSQFLSLSFMVIFPGVRSVYDVTRVVSYIDKSVTSSNVHFRRQTQVYDISKQRRLHFNVTLISRWKKATLIYRI